mgnify:CR=1 FL=1
MIYKILIRLKFLSKLNQKLAKHLFSIIINFDHNFLKLRIFLISIFLKKDNKVKVALKDLKKGHLIRPVDVALKRTGTTGSGVPIRLLDDALNRELKVNITKDHPISEEQV